MCGHEATQCLPELRGWIYTSADPSGDGVAAGIVCRETAGIYAARAFIVQLGGHRCPFGADPNDRTGETLIVLLSDCHGPARPPGTKGCVKT
jgi:hypothetical protein